jgi:Zn-dependent protease with chaperone function
MRAASSARRAFWSLALLGGLSLLAMLALLLWQGPVLASGVWLACQNAAAALAGYLPAAGLLVPVTVLTIGLVRASLSLITQLRHTRRLVGDLSFRRRRLPTPLTQLAEALELAGRLELVEDSTAYTFTEGLWRPKIWLSSGLVELLDEGELEAVLRHERHHVRQRDPLRVLITRTLADGLFFLPVATALRDTYLVSKEMEADAASSANDSLAAALVKILRQGAQLPPAASLAAIGPVSATAARIQRLLARDRRTQLRFVTGRHLMISVALVCLIVLTSYGAMVRAASPLTGGECGYTTRIDASHDPSVLSNYTPAMLGAE